MRGRSDVLLDVLHVDSLPGMQPVKHGANPLYLCEGHQVLSGLANVYVCV